jgi:hypothetical protein
LKIRRDTVAVSSILFTLALLIPMPAMLVNAWTGNYHAQIGFDCLAIIVIGLIVTWAGYIKGVGWTWFVMFVIACGWAFPVLVLPEFHWRNMLPIAQWPPLRVSSHPRLEFAQSVLTLLLMVLALVVPVKTFVLANHRRWDLRIRRSAVAVSGILFTLALLVLTPAMLEDARVTHEARFRDIMNEPPAAITDQVAIPNWYAPVGITSVAVIAIGLIVTWAGYIKGVRWTWFVMFVIVWVWAFPGLVLPFFYPWNSTASIAQMLGSAIHESLHAGPYRALSRTFLEVVLVFLLMVVALVLPVKTFILGQADGPGKSGCTNLGVPDKHALPEI